jgi:uncharacterized protein GlcG (DUF336 family)
MFNRLILILASAALAAGPLAAQNCAALPDANQLRTWLNKAPNEGGDEGGLFHGKREWAVVVNRQGQVCAEITSTTDPTQVWPGSESIAKAKAFTANGFSIDSLPISTARLYTLTQPGHSLYGTAFAEPFNPVNLEVGNRNQPIVQGGAISFGGGVPLYKNGKIIGALGVSGDTSCADHETAKRVRSLVGLDPPGGSNADDIVYEEADGPSIYEHPLCINTWRNGKFIGNESPEGLQYTKTATPAPPAANQASREKRIQQAKKPH